MLRRLLVLAAIALLPGLSGCADLWPNVCSPGWYQTQRERADRFDPYPEPDSGPDLVGARPREFDKPRPENTRVQNEVSWYERYRQPSPPGMFHSESPIFAPAVQPPVLGAPPGVLGAPPATGFPAAGLPADGPAAY